MSTSPIIIRPIASTSHRSSRSSSKFCLLLKTLLFLLCIYIKRVTAAPALSTTPTPNTLVPVTAKSANSTIRVISKTGSTLPNVDVDFSYAFETEVKSKLDCRIDQYLIKERDATRIARSLSKKKNKTCLPDNLRANLTNNLKVTWFKDGKIFHRINGNPVEGIDSEILTLFNVGESDAGTYTCYPNYTTLPKLYYRYFDFHESLTFELKIDSRASLYPDEKPTVSHPPGNLVVHRRSNVTFTCNKKKTFGQQITYWFEFKTSNFSNDDSEKQFMRAYNASRSSGSHLFLEKYLVKDHHADELHLYNVSGNDTGFYGCFVGNLKGIDIRLGSLKLLDNYYEPRVLSSIVKTVPENEDTDMFLYGIVAVASGLIIFGFLVFASCLGTSCYTYKKEKKICGHYDITTPIIGDSCKDPKERQHLPSGDCTDIYNIGKTPNGFISGHLHQNGGHLMSQSICNILAKEKNPSISSNSNSDEASSWGKSMSSQGDSSRAVYLAASNTTSTTVPVYDHPPSTGTARFHGAIVHDACASNPTYGLVPGDLEATEWNFPRRNLERLNKIGEGQFGEVWRYIARQKDGTEQYVAVKQLRTRFGMDHRERLELIGEIEIMKLVCDHPNVIRLMNCCVDYEQPILLIMEYAENGKLQTYLRNCRASRQPYGYQRDPYSPTITSKELIKFAYHVSKGMEYIASKGIVHRDLASRNILVSKDKICKVADFGFARRLNDDCPYERSTANPLPFKWMAPEALNENKFTTKSDVFSIGILMWEIVTLGATPYEYMTCPEVCIKVTNGGRPERPAHCKDEFFQLMAACWQHEPSRRPTFKELSLQLEKLLLSENNYIELDRYPQHAYYNILNVAEKEVVKPAN